MTQDLVICIVCVVAFVLLGLLFLSGRGWQLIAGYNTMPREERERYDTRALCRFMGKLMLYIAACIAMLGADTLWPGQGWASACRIWLPIGVIGALIYANTGGRFLKR